MALKTLYQCHQHEGEFPAGSGSITAANSILSPSLCMFPRVRSCVREGADTLALVVSVVFLLLGLHASLTRANSITRKSSLPGTRHSLYAFLPFANSTPRATRLWCCRWPQGNYTATARTMVFSATAVIHLPRVSF
ncbi:uncharacterized protein J3R85_018886 [Psidium guajava]|nr:uncharacterized protein J3R85_018886 [Psidium guajava]